MGRPHDNAGWSRGVAAAGDEAGVGSAAVCLAFLPSAALPRRNRSALTTAPFSGQLRLFPKGSHSEISAEPARRDSDASQHVGFAI